MQAKTSRLILHLLDLRGLTWFFAAIYVISLPKMWPHSEDTAPQSINSG
jgi:hypothetical protein